ncbi:MAG: hypothetical protein AB7J19_08040, partial [Beijerinckiaceae bacterium]
LEIDRTPGNPKQLPDGPFGPCTGYATCPEKFSPDTRRLHTAALVRTGRPGGYSCRQTPVLRAR